MQSPSNMLGTPEKTAPVADRGGAGPHRLAPALKKLFNSHENRFVNIPWNVAVRQYHQAEPSGFDSGRNCEPDFLFGLTLNRHLESILAHGEINRRDKIFPQMLPGRDEFFTYFYRRGG